MKKSTNFLISMIIILGLTILETRIAQGINLQEGFDSYPTTFPPFSSVTASSGRTITYSTFGDSDGQPILLFMGTIHSWADIDYFSAYRSMTEQLGLYIIQPERPGYGKTPFVPLTPQEYADDMNDLMTQLGHEEFVVLAVSAGGPWADHFVTRYPSKVKSLHHLSSGDTSGNFPPFCPTASPTTWLGLFQFIYQTPQIVLGLFLPQDVDVALSIPGFSDWFTLQIPTSADPINQSDIGIANDLYTTCNFPITDFSMATFPTFIYHGELDLLNVPFNMAENHAIQYPNVAAFNRYPNGAHFMSLRHFGQVLVDMAGMSDKTLLCHNGKTKLVGGNAAQAHLSHGDILDICAWKETAAENQ